MGYLDRLFSSSSATGTRDRLPGRTSRRICLCVFIALFVLGAGGAAAAESWSYDLAGELMSPYCPGRTLSSCTSSQASELVQWMVVQEAAGVTREEVIAILVERFGEEILGAPPAKGFALWAYVLPILGFVFGGGLVVLVLGRIVGRSADSASGSTQGIEPASRPANTGATAQGVRYVDDDDLARLVDDEFAARG
jgi:cytochrome c-type biogenesis protein CcmH/NrfF